MKLKNLILGLLALVVFNANAQKPPQLVLQEKHAKYSWVSSLNFTENGKYIISTADNAKLWDVATGLLVRDFIGHTDGIKAAAVINNGNTLVTTGQSSDKTIRFWDIATGKQLHIIQSDVYMDKIFFADDDESIFITINYLRKTVDIWDAAALKYLGKVPISTGVDNVDVEGSRKMALKKCYDKFMRIENIEDGEVIKKLKESFNGSRFRSIVLSEKYNELIFGVDETNNAMIVDAKSGKKRTELIGHTKSISSIAISPDYKFIATGGFDQIVKIWDYQTGRLLKTLDDPFTYESFWAIPPEGDFAIVATTKSARVFSLETGRPGKELPIKMPELIRSIHMPDSKTFVVFDKVKANVYNYPECTLRCTGPSHVGAGIQSNELELSPNKRFAATLDVYPMNNVHVWDFNTGKIIKTFSGKNNIDGAAITNDLFAIAIDDHVDVYSFDGASFNKKYTFKVPSLPGEEAYAMYGIEISPNNKYLVVEAGKGVSVTMWSLESGKQIREFDKKAIAVSHFNNDNTIVALGHIDGPFSLYNIQSGEKMADFPGHTKHVKEFYFVDENKKLLTTSFDGLTKFWDIEKNELIATFVSVGGDDFLTFVPEGPYMASPKALKALAIRVDNRAYPFDQYDLLLNKPHKVLEEIGSASESVLEIYKKAYQKRLKRMGFTEDMLKLDYHLPEIAYTGELPLSTKNKEITFGVNASDSKYNLDRINVWVNDVPVFSSKGISLKSKDVKTHQQDITVELTEGNNKIQVSVHNQNGIESIRELFNLNYEGASPKPDLYLVTIGVSEFKNAAYNLTYAAKDATDIQKAFNEKSSYNNVHAFNFTNANAISDSILKVKEELKKSKIDDKVIIFVASHGLLDNNMDYYIATHDVDFNNPAARGLAYEKLEGLFDGIPARQKLMIIDACHSGEVDKEDMVLADANISGGSVKARGFKTVKTKENQLGVENSFELMRELFADLRRGTGAVVISSAGGAEFAFESSEWKNGVFTYALLEGLKTGNADADKNGEIVVSELRNYVFERVKKLTNGQQNPTSRRENLEFDFRVW